MLRICVAVLATGTAALVGCAHSDYATRPIPAIAAGIVGKPVHRLEEAFGAPRKVDRTPTKLVYDWFLAQAPAGAPVGFHGCEMEVTVDIRSEHVLGYSLANIGWGRCQDVQRKIRIAEG
jgi:hypothetical protein